MAPKPAMTTGISARAGTSSEMHIGRILGPIFSTSARTKIHASLSTFPPLNLPSLKRESLESKFSISAMVLGTTLTL